jgi:hypothetical protein
MQGRDVDMEAMRTKNELAVAVGNVNVNARGDQIKGGRVVKSRDQVVSEYYDTNPNAVPRQTPVETKVEPKVEPVLAKRVKPAVKTVENNTSVINSTTDKNTEEKNVD